MFVVALLDVLFAYAFAGLALAVLIVGVRIVLVSNDHRCVLWSTIFMVSGLIAAASVCVWAFIHVERAPKSCAHRSAWNEVKWRYPALLCPLAYYLGGYRPNKVHASTFTGLMENRRALDLISFVAWRGTLAVYSLVIGAFVAPSRKALSSSPWLGHYSWRLFRSWEQPFSYWPLWLWSTQLQRGHAIRSGCASLRLFRGSDRYGCADFVNTIRE